MSANKHEMNKKKKKKNLTAVTDPVHGMAPCYYVVYVRNINQKHIKVSNLL